MNREQLAARFPHASASTIARNCDGIALKYSIEEPIKKSAQMIVAGEASGKITTKLSTDEEKLNKLERDYLAYLRALGHGWIGIQNITLKLGHDTRYTPDFWIVGGAGLQALETKGSFFRDDAKVKIKVAARLFPFINFVLVRRLKGQWEFETVKP